MCTESRSEHAIWACHYMLSSAYPACMHGIHANPVATLEASILWSQARSLPVLAYKRVPNSCLQRIIPTSIYNFPSAINVYFSGDYAGATKYSGYAFAPASSVSPLQGHIHMVWPLLDAGEWLPARPCQVSLNSNPHISLPKAFSDCFNHFPSASLLEPFSSCFISLISAQVLVTC